MLDNRYPVIPGLAPFSSGRAAWLNGFFAGMFGIDGAVKAMPGLEWNASEPGFEREQLGLRPAAPRSGQDVTTRLADWHEPP